MPATRPAKQAVSCGGVSWAVFKACSSRAWRPAARRSSWFLGGMGQRYVTTCQCQLQDNRTRMTSPLYQMRALHMAADPRNSDSSSGTAPDTHCCDLAEYANVVLHRGDVEGAGGGRELRLGQRRGRLDLLHVVLVLALSCWCRRECGGTTVDAAVLVLVIRHHTVVPGQRRLAA